MVVPRRAVHLCRGRRSGRNGRLTNTFACQPVPGQACVGDQIARLSCLDQPSRWCLDLRCHGRSLRRRSMMSLLQSHNSGTPKQAGRLL